MQKVVHKYASFEAAEAADEARFREMSGQEKLQILAFGFGQTGIVREDFLREGFVIHLGVEPNRIDLLTGISGVQFEEAWPARESGMLGDVPVCFLSRDMPIRNKRASARSKDLADASLLERTRPKPQ